MRLVTAYAATLLAAACSNTTVVSSGSSSAAAAATAPLIVTQPASVSIAAGASASFTVVATGSAPLSYQWTRNGVILSGATGSSYSTGPASTAANGARFSVTVSNAAGSVSSASATLTVQATAVAPAISVQPAAQSIAVGQSATFIVVSSGTPPLSYQWQKNGAALTAATGSSYVTGPVALTDNGAVFTVTVSNAGGSVTSKPATLTVYAPATAPAISVQPAAATVTVGQSATFTVTGSGSAPLAYQWLKNGVALSGATASSYATGPVTTTDSGTEFSVTVSNSAGRVTSSGALLTVLPFGHVVIVVEENANYASVVGNTTAMPYLNSLITKYGLATQYYANAHPSISDYFMLTTGQILTSNDNETPATFPVSVDNIVRELNAGGRTWRAYAEDLPYVGYLGGDTGNYAVRHVPFAYLSDVQDSAAGRQGLVPFSQFATDLAAGQLPNLSFVTPNLCDDAHNCALSVADTWLQSNIGPLLQSVPFRDDGLLIVTFDESANDDTNGGGRIATVFISVAASKSGYQSTTLYQHQSTLRLMLQGLGINVLPGAAASAPQMWEFFSFPAPP